MPWKIADENGDALDAHVEAADGVLVLHSRGGTIGSANARNTNYGEALRLIIRRLKDSPLKPVGVWVDSSRVQDLALPERKILDSEEFSQDQPTIFALLSSRMARVGKEAGAESARGNSNKKLRFEFAGDPAAHAILEIVGGISTEEIHTGRLPIQQLGQVTAEHVWRSVQNLLSGQEHKFGPSTDYDVLLDDGQALPPKAVFGLAATEALGFEVLPQHFSAGLGTVCFRTISEAGFRIVRKNDAGPDEAIPAGAEERMWSEGNPRLVMHLRRERASGLARAKKAEFARVHGRLFCERCGLVPSVQLDRELGDACIEVHHDRLAVSNMDEGHQTQLSDLMCLCANCHRIVHFEMRRDLAPVPAQIPNTGADGKR